MRVIYIYTQYRHNRWVICRQYTGDLPFTGYLPVVYGPLLSKCTENTQDGGENPIDINIENAFHLFQITNRFH